MCSMDITSGKFAWIEEANQNRTTGVTGESIVETSKIEGKCYGTSTYIRQLNNGRECENDRQCMSTTCSGGVCVGQASGTI